MLTDLVNDVEVLFERFGGYVAEVLPQDIHERLHKSKRVQRIH